MDDCGRVCAEDITIVGDDEGGGDVYYTTSTEEARVHLQCPVLVDDVQPAGRYSVVFSGAHLPGGLYLYRLLAPNARREGQMTMVGR